MIVKVEVVGAVIVQPVGAVMVCGDVKPDPVKET